MKRLALNYDDEHIPFIDSYYVTFQASKIGVHVDHNDINAIHECVSQHPINPHLLYSGEFIYQSLDLLPSAEIAFVGYDVYKLKYRDKDPHPLLSIAFLEYFGFDPSYSDIFSYLANHRSLFSILSPVLSSSYISLTNDCGDNRETGIPASIRSYLENSLLVNYPENFKSTLLHDSLLSPSNRNLIEILCANEEVSTAHACKRGPRVDIVTPTFNSSIQFLSDLISSIRAQTYANWRLILFDDGSSDREHLCFLDSIIRYESRIRLVRSYRNLGISDATNHAIGYCRGDYILFVDHDDILHPECISELLTSIQKDETDAAYSDHYLMTEDSKILKYFKKGPWDPIFYIQVMYLCHPILVKRSKVIEIGGFCSEFDKIQDYEFMIRLLASGGHVSYCSRGLYYWRAAATSFASDSHAKGCIQDLQVAASNSYLKYLGLESALKAVPNNNHPHRLSIVCLIANPVSINQEACTQYLDLQDMLQMVKDNSAPESVWNKQFYPLSNNWIGWGPSDCAIFENCISMLSKYTLFDDVAICSMAQIDESGLYVSHGYSLSEGMLSSCAQSLSSTADDGTGIPISDRCVHIANPGIFIFRSDLVNLRLLKLSTVLNLDYLVLCLSMMARRRKLRVVSVSHSEDQFCGYNHRLESTVMSNRLVKYAISEKN